MGTFLVMALLFMKPSSPSSVLACPVLDALGKLFTIRIHQNHGVRKNHIRSIVPRDREGLRGGGAGGGGAGALGTWTATSQRNINGKLPLP